MSDNKHRRAVEMLSELGAMPLWAADIVDSDMKLEAWSMPGRGRVVVLQTFSENRGIEIYISTEHNDMVAVRDQLAAL